MIKGQAFGTMNNMLIVKVAVALFILSTLSNAQAENLTKDKTFMLGAYYYAWYEAPNNENDLGWMGKALRGRLKPVQLPKLGVYDSRDPKVIKGHIEQSKHAGIDFWSVSWWGQNRQNETFKDHILKHPCLLYTSPSPRD